jgi:hypothetical protein
MDLFVVHLIDNGKHHDTRSPTEVDASIEISGKNKFIFFSATRGIPNVNILNGKQKKKKEKKKLVF